MDLSKFKSLFNLLVMFIPGALGNAISKAEAIATSGHDKKSIVMGEITNALSFLNTTYGVDPNHPKIQAAMGKINDAIVETANVVQELQDGGNVQVNPVLTAASADTTKK